MATNSVLQPKNEAALQRLRDYRAPPSIYNSLPFSRRSAVLILLFEDSNGNLRVVLTLRAATLRTHAGQVACPGGKADSLDELPFDTARREAFEEIGLPLDDSRLPLGYRVEHLAELDTNLAKVHLAVRPCVAFIHAPRGGPTSTRNALIPTLDPKEVAAVFTEKLENFLHDAIQQPLGIGSSVPWHQAEAIDWFGSRWIMHAFNSQEEPLLVKSTVGAGEDERSRLKEVQPGFKIFGLTARLMMDCAKVAYGRGPDFDHLLHSGDEETIRRLHRRGGMGNVDNAGPAAKKIFPTTVRATEKL